MTHIHTVISSFKDKVFNTCLGMVKNYQDAQDISQEVFIEVYLKLPGFREEASMSTWIYRIAINKCLQYLRSQKAQKRSGQTLEISEHMADAVSFDHPGVKLENQELARLLFQVMEKLPENQRIAFTLHKVEHLGHEEIGQIMQKSRSSIESLIHRAKENLKNHLKAHYEKY